MQQRYFLIKIKNMLFSQQFNLGLHIRFISDIDFFNILSVLLFDVKNCLRVFFFYFGYQSQMLSSRFSD